MLLALNPFGEETRLSWIPEVLLKRFFYRDLEDLAPAKAGLYTQTPMVNEDVLREVRNGKVSWLRGDIQEFEENGAQFNHRGKGIPKGGVGREELIEGSICVMATGFHRPSLAFLPKESFNPPYSPPNWFLQTFPIGYPDICATNSTYVNAIGTVGNIHIGLYTRLLLMFIVDQQTRPSPAWMRAWVDWTRTWKWPAAGGALEFFTYSELIIWIILSLAINPWRWKWIPFVLNGFGKPFYGGKMSKVETHEKYGTQEITKEDPRVNTQVEGKNASESPSYAATLSSNSTDRQLNEIVAKPGISIDHNQDSDPTNGGRGSSKLSDIIDPPSVSQILRRQQKV